MINQAFSKFRFYLCKHVPKNWACWSSLNALQLIPLVSVTTLVVCKLLQIDKKLMQAAGMVARVKNEVEIHSRLKHPAVLELYNYFEDANYVYLVVEMCHNGELNRYLKNTQTRLRENDGRGFSLLG